MAYPRLTKNATVLDSWARLATLYDSSFVDSIKTADGQQANAVWIEARTNAIQLAYGLTTPTVIGHVMNSGDSQVMDNQEYIKRCWIRNDTAGSAGTLVITPIYE